MRSFLFTILLSSCICIHGNAQVPPVIQWQKCYGGTSADRFGRMVPTPDGGYIVCGSSMSADGDIGANYGFVDVYVMKTDASGNIQWRKNYGSTGPDYGIAILATADGGYIFLGMAGAGDIDVTGYHPGTAAGLRDIWVVKINNTGTIQWQRCYGGPGDDVAFEIQQTTDGGYIVAASTETSGGDISALHGDADIWIFKIDAMGALQWQRPYGGTLSDNSTVIIATSDGGFLIGGASNSHDGDINCSNVKDGLWLVKLDNAGGIQWQTCLDDVFIDHAFEIRQTTDGGYIVVGGGWISGAPTLPNLGEIDAFAMKLDAAGNMQWRHIMGGTTGQDGFYSVLQTPDGAYVLAGWAQSTDGDICFNHGQYDFFIVKLNSNGTTNWRKTYGGSLFEWAKTILLTPDGGYLVGGLTFSNDGDVSGNHSLNNNEDVWLVKLSFPGVPVLPTINIVADKTTICPGQVIIFVAEITDGGDAPTYQWQVNGINTGPNNDTVTISSLNDGDIVSCILTSNSACVTDPTGNSNAIAITVDPSLNPSGFLLADKEVCRLGEIDLVPSGIFSSYLWNTNAVTPTLTITQPGEYWLQVTTSTGCPGRDTVIVTQKECLKGFYMPTAFTPNNDGRNDLLKPVIGGTVLQYKFTIINRWGQVVFQTTDTQKGWDGKFKGLVQDGNVYVWTCSYRLPGEKLKLAKGSFVLIR
ncbi:MAG TPA: T9SS type B sorting domain-containing protein [Chitinophagaceae bacterium]|nr:T9SS type B sorting domain-containing protein [Chitinophagaceae bacterium]